MKYIFDLYKIDKRWFFDDPSKNIYQEEFIDGVPEIIEAYVGDKAVTAKIILNDSVPDDASGEIQYHSLHYAGSLGEWTRYEDTDFDGSEEIVYGEGWFCPTFWKYFSKPAPEVLYFRIMAM